MTELNPNPLPQKSYVLNPLWIILPLVIIGGLFWGLNSKVNHTNSHVKDQTAPAQQIKNLSDGSIGLFLQSEAGKKQFAKVIQGLLSSGFQGPQGPAGPAGGRGLQGTPGSYSGGCASDCVSLQTTTPGNPQPGSFNVNGTGTVGNLTTGDINPAVAGGIVPAMPATNATRIIDATYGAGEEGTAQVLGTDGFSRLAYNIYGNVYQILYARCQNAACSSKVKTILVDAGTNSGPTYDYFWNTSIALGSDGFARIVYVDQHYDGANWFYKVNYIRCQNDDCTASTSQTIASAINDNYGQYTTGIVMAKDGFPRITYDSEYDGDSGVNPYNPHLNFARCTDADCSSPVITPLPSFYPEYYWNSSPAIGPDGYARMAYESYNDGFMHYYRCTDADCTSPIDTVVDNSGNYPGYYGQMVLMGKDGFAKLAYLDGNDNLYYINCSNDNCTSPKPLLIASTYSNYAWQGFALNSQGIPSFSYDDSKDYFLRYTTCSDVSCANLNTVKVDSVTYESSYYANALSVDSQNKAHIAYSDGNGAYELHYALVAPGTPSSSIAGTNIGSPSRPFGSIHVQTANVNSLLPITPGNYSASNGVFSEQVDTVGNAGEYGTSIAVGADGFARIAYNNDGSPLDFIRCTDSKCLSPIKTLVDSNGAYYASIVMGPDGFPRIAYSAYDTNSGYYNLRLARCTDADCTNPVLTDVDLGDGVNSPANYGLKMSLGNDGLPRIIELNYNSNSIPSTYYIRYIQCTNSDCSSSNTQDIPNAYQYVYNNFGISVGADGFARIAYEDSNDYYLKMVRCLNNGCTSSNTNVIDQTSSYPGSYGIAIKIESDGFAGIAYITQNSNYPLKFVKCTDADCSSPQINTLSNTDSETEFGIAMVLGPNGKPIISYDNYDNKHGNYAIYAAICDDLACSSLSVVLVDPTTNYATYYGTDLAIGSDGLPQFAYSDDGCTNCDLHYARFLTNDGQDIVVHTVGSNVGASNAFFGQAYFQGGLLQDASDKSILAINQQGTGDILDLQSNGANVFSANSNGDVAIKPIVNSNHTFQVQNAAGTPIFWVDTISGQTHISNISINNLTVSTLHATSSISTSQISANEIYLNRLSFTNNGLSQASIDKYFSCDGNINTLDVVIISGSANYVQTTATPDSKLVAGISRSSCSTNGITPIVFSGVYQVNVDTSAVNIGDLLTTSSTTGQATVGTPAVGNVLGKALSSKAAGSPGIVWVLLTLQ